MGKTLYQQYIDHPDVQETEGGGWQFTKAITTDGENYFYQNQTEAVELSSVFGCFLHIFGRINISIAISHWLGVGLDKYAGLKMAQTAGRFKWWQAVPVGLLMYADDASTAIGFQADNKKRFEGNFAVSQWCANLVESGLAKTESQAMMYLDIGFQATVLFWYWMNAHPVARLTLLGLGVTKARAGWGWNGLKPNDYSFPLGGIPLLFGKGRRTPEVLSLIEYVDQWPQRDMSKVLQDLLDKG